MESTAETKVSQSCLLEKLSPIRIAEKELASNELVFLHFGA